MCGNENSCPADAGKRDLVLAVVAVIVLVSGTLTVLRDDDSVDVVDSDRVGVVVFEVAVGCVGDGEFIGP